MSKQSNSQSYPSKCVFCGAKMSFHVNEKGEKVINKPCECVQSKAAFGYRKTEVIKKE